jgi:hypothetical protein
MAGPGSVSGVRDPCAKRQQTCFETVTPMDWITPNPRWSHGSKATTPIITSFSIATRQSRPSNRPAKLDSALRPDR